MQGKRATGPGFRPMGEERAACQAKIATDKTNVVYGSAGGMMLNSAVVDSRHNIKNKLLISLHYQEHIQLVI